MENKWNWFFILFNCIQGLLSCLCCWSKWSDHSRFNKNPFLCSICNAPLQIIWTAHLLPLLLRSFLSLPFVCKLPISEDRSLKGAFCWPGLAWLSSGRFWTDPFQFLPLTTFNDGYDDRRRTFSNRTERNYAFSSLTGASFINYQFLFLRVRLLWRWLLFDWQW